MINTSSQTERNKQASRGAMDVMKHFHMNGGTGKTSYSVNSSVQRRIISITKPIIEEVILDIFSTTKVPKNSTLRIADLGCCSGPNTLMVVSYVLETIYNVCQQSNCPSPEFLVFLNDLPNNDFNAIFMSLPSYYNKLKETKGDDFGPCCVAGIPGTFYGRLFPSESLHFIHSSSSLHWLSQVPRGIEATNKGNILMAQSSPPSVFKAYFEQFQNDFSIFLRSRSEELVHGGRMVLTILSRRSEDPSSRECTYIWELLAVALNDMVTKGMIDKEKLDSFNMPNYMPSPTEIRTAIESNGSFVVNRLEIFDVHWDAEYGTLDILDKFRSSSNVANCLRAVFESYLVSHFGEELLIDKVFERYRELVEELMSNGETAEYVIMVVSMTRKSAKCQTL